MVSFIDEYRSAYGVEPICKELPIAPSTYYEQKSREIDPDRIPAREKVIGFMKLILGEFGMKTCKFMVLEKFGVN